MSENDGDASLRRPRLVVVAALGTSQTLAWASSYYLPAVLALPISAAIAVPSSWVFAAFSAALLIAAMAGPTVGRMIDRHGGRGVLVFSNVVLAAGLAALACASGPVSLFAAWAILGIGMALGLYDAGFATLTALYGADARGSITGITLLAGFASTLSWPLSSFLDDAAGWRGTCLVWAALNLFLGWSRRDWPRRCIQLVQPLWGSWAQPLRCRSLFFMGPVTGFSRSPEAPFHSQYSGLTPMENAPA